MLTFYGAGKKAAHAAKTVKHGVSEWSSVCFYRQDNSYKPQFAMW